VRGGSVVGARTRAHTVAKTTWLPTLRQAATCSYTTREVFRQQRDLNTDDEHPRVQFILQYPNLAGLLKVQSLTKTNKAFTIIVSPVEGTTRNVISAVAIPYNLQDEDESPEIRFLKGSLLTIEQATESSIIVFFYGTISFYEVFYIIK